MNTTEPIRDWEPAFVKIEIVSVGLTHYSQGKNSTLWCCAYVEKCL